MAIYQQKVAKCYNSRVRSKAFKVGDLVLKKSKVFQLTEVRKLSSKWEGPYQVVKIIKLEAYQLQRSDGSIIPRS